MMAITCGQSSVGVEIVRGLDISPADAGDKNWCNNVGDRRTSSDCLTQTHLTIEALSQVLSAQCNDAPKNSTVSRSKFDMQSCSSI